MIGDGRGVNPYQNFSRDEFNKVIRQASNDTPVFFRGDYHSSWLFSRLRRTSVEDNFKGIPVKDAVYSYLEYIRNSSPKNHEVNFKKEYPYDLDLSSKGFQIPKEFFTGLTQPKSSGLILAKSRNCEVVPIFHLPLTKRNKGGDLITRIIRHREDDIFCIKKVEGKLAILIQE